jgi:hypothetical protein
MKEVLFNTEVIAVNQDPLTQQGDRVLNHRCDPSQPATCQVWAKPLSPENKFAVIFYNSANSNSYDITLKFSHLGIVSFKLTHCQIHSFLSIPLFTFTICQVGKEALKLL